MTAAGSVVVPAHQEEAVIGVTLAHLLDGLDPGVAVLVAANGCTDGTVRAAAGAGPRVQVLDLPRPSKTAALRHADAALGDAFPRLYLDADVRVSGPDASAVLAALRDGGSPAARPAIEYDVSRCTPLVRSYYRARTRLPSVMSRLWGAGAFGLSAEGHARVVPWPDLVADDLHADRAFAADEVLVVEGTRSVVRVPRSATDLLRVLRRTYRGKAEQVTGPEAVPVQASRELVAGLRQGHLVDVTVYTAFSLLGRIAHRVAAPTAWERDESSRS